MLCRRGDDAGCFLMVKNGEVSESDSNVLFSFLTQCYYPHTSRESVSPVCRIFFYNFCYFVFPIKAIAACVLCFISPLTVNKVLSYLHLIQICCFKIIYNDLLLRYTENSVNICFILDAEVQFLKSSLKIRSNGPARKLDHICSKSCVKTSF